MFPILVLALLAAPALAQEDLQHHASRLVDDTEREIARLESGRAPGDARALRDMRRLRILALRFESVASGSDGRYVDNGKRVYAYRWRNDGFATDSNDGISDGSGYGYGFNAYGGRYGSGATSGPKFRSRRLAYRVGLESAFRDLWLHADGMAMDDGLRRRIHTIARQIDYRGRR